MLKIGLKKGVVVKVVAFNGSPRAGGNTFQLLNHVLNELKAEGIETQLIQLGNKPLRGCIACGACWKNKDKRCVLTDDPMNEYIEAMLSADGILLGSPTYCADMTANMKALIERACYVAKANGDMLARKVGAAVIAVRRGGAINVFSSINNAFLILQMIVPGSSYWNEGIGREPGDVEQDEEGLRTMSNLGKNMVWLLKKITG